MKYVKNIIEEPYLKWYNSSVKSHANAQQLTLSHYIVLLSFDWKKCGIATLIIEKSTLKVDEKIVAREFKITN